MTGKTEIYGLIGSPLAHSLSPLMHNAAYRAMGLNAHYTLFETRNLAETAKMIRDRGIMGVSVTLPFKQAVLPFLDELDNEAAQIGAVNTITNRGGQLTGSNTDWLGLLEDLRGRFEISGREVAVIGAGGAARAALYGVLRHGGVPVVVNRTVSKGEDLAREFGCRFLPLSEIRSLDGAGLINTTPVGMTPRVDETPVSRDGLHRFRWVADVIYTPLVTRLLREADGAGCETCNGLGMFVNQGAEQIRIWTGKTAPKELMRKVVTERLSGEDAGSMIQDAKLRS